LVETPPGQNSAERPLTPEEFGQLYDAFLDAFNASANLERVVAFSFTGVDLADISEGDLRTKTAALIRWADTQHAIPTLIAGARKENDGNKRLQDVDAYWRNRPAGDAPNTLRGDSTQIPFPTASTLRRNVRPLHVGIVILVIVALAGTAWWLTHRDGQPDDWVIESFPANVNGKWFGSSWHTTRVQGIAEPSPNQQSGFLRFMPQDRFAPASAERTLGDGVNGVLLQPYCDLLFRVRLNLDGTNPLPRGVDGAAVSLKQSETKAAVALSQYIPNPSSFDWQLAQVPLQAFIRAGLDARSPVMALGFDFTMPSGNTVDVDDIAFRPCADGLESARYVPVPHGREGIAGGWSLGITPAMITDAGSSSALRSMTSSSGG
jgi:hypothetical protein